MTPTRRARARRPPPFRGRYWSERRVKDVRPAVQARLTSYAAPPINRIRYDMSAASRTINFTLNGEVVTAEVAPHHSLVEVLQREFDLTGARESCGQGLCGCCTVLVDGRAVSGCLYLAVFADGAEVVTVEHLGSRERLTDVQEAFIE